MKNELAANKALADYNEKEYNTRMQWQRVLGAPSQPRQIKSKQVNFFYKLFKVL